MSTEQRELNLLVEALLTYLGPKEARRFLRCVAARVVVANSEPVPIRAQCSYEPDEALTDRMRERLSYWLVKHG